MKQVNLDNNLFEAELHIKNFNGPLDLLLTLVKEKEMDIFDIDLLELANSYLHIIDKLKNKNFDLIAEYLVMATTLLQLKAKMLLENPEDKEELTEQKKRLLSQLVEYQKYKQIAEKLRNKEALRKEIFIKKVSNYDNYPFVVNDAHLDGNSSPIKLINALKKMFERLNFEKLFNVQAKIENFNFSPLERRQELILIFKKEKNPTFETIFSVPSINHFVVTIITILDMVSKGEILINQKEPLGKIYFERGVINE